MGDQLVRCITNSGKRIVAEAIDIHTHFVPGSIPQQAGRNPLWPSIEREALTALR